MLTVSISPDGKKLILNSLSGINDGDILSFDLGEKQELSALFEAGYYEFSGQISPNGKYIAYDSNETGRFEVFINTYPDLRGKWQVSAGGGFSQPGHRVAMSCIFMISAAK